MNALRVSPADRARRYIARVPGAVQGNHGDCQTLTVANVLVWGFALSPVEALSILREYNARCLPPWSEAELIRKIHSAERQPHARPRGHLLGSGRCGFEGLAVPRLPVGKGPPKVRVDPATATENFLKGFRCDDVDLWEVSPVRPPDDWTKDALALVVCLYRPGEGINFVTAFKESTDKDGKPKANPIGAGEMVERDSLLARWRNAGLPQSKAGGWLRMNPLDGAGVGDSNVTAFRFALIECDTVPVELQLPLLSRLPLPIAAIVTSGGRSLHAWVRVDAGDLNDYRQTVARMLELLTKFGVDGKNKNPSRLSRLPGVVRVIGAEGDGRQRLLYLNPQPVQKAIL